MASLDVEQFIAESEAQNAENAAQLKAQREATNRKVAEQRQKDRDSYGTVKHSYNGEEPQ